MAQSTKKEPKVPVALTQGKLMLRMLRLNSSWVSLISVIVLGTFIVSQDVQTYLDQRREIVEMEESIAQAAAAVAPMHPDRAPRPAPGYRRTHARDRLYYVLPGEVSYLVMDSEGMDFSDTSGTVGALLSERRSADEISAEVSAAEDNWVDSLLETFLRSALEQPEEE